MSLSAARMAAPIEAGLIVIGAVGAGTAALALAIGVAVVDELTGHAIVPALGLVAAGVAVTGAATITGLSVARLKTVLRAALIAALAADIQKTTDTAEGLASVLVDEITTYGTVPGTGFAAPPAGGALTGSSTVEGLNVIRLAGALNDVLEGPMSAEPGVATAGLALAISGAVVLELVTHAVVPPGLLVAPAGGGPVTGGSVIT